MAPFPVEVLLGIYLGFLTGIIPAMVAWLLGFVFRYVTGVTVPGLGVVVYGIVAYRWSFSREELAGLRSMMIRRVPVASRA